MAKFHPGIVPFAARFSLTAKDAKRLVQAVQLAVKAQEQEHNTGKDSTRECNALDRLAARLGFKQVDWSPGLYPRLSRDGQQWLSTGDLCDFLE